MISNRDGYGRVKYKEEDNSPHGDSISSQDLLSLIIPSFKSNFCYIKMLLSLLVTAGLAACAAVPSTSSCIPQIGGGITEEGVVNKNCCAELTVIFARGTTESGNLGTIVGPPLLAALRASLGSSNVLGQGVDYPASLEVGSSPCDFRNVPVDTNRVLRQTAPLADRPWPPWSSSPCLNVQTPRSSCPDTRREQRSFTMPCHLRA